MRAIGSMIEMNYDYPNNLGRLIANINSLEVEIRFFLLIDEYGWEEANQWAKSLLTVDTHGQSPWHFTVQASLDLNPDVLAISHTQ